MDIVVQKYGGTSVASESARHSLLRHVEHARRQGKQVVLVVSAMGRKGDPYSTDTIISLLESINPHIAPEKKDLLASCGETISCSLIAHFLDTNGIEAEAMTGFQAGILTTGEFNNSNIISIDTTNIHKYLSQGRLPVIAGFQGITRDGRITTLGRGGSDTTAVELGGYLGAEMVDIFTDVPGVAFVDPRVFPPAEYISRISYDDMYLLASNGAKVIHPRAVSAAKKFNVPVRVRSTCSDAEGTLITGRPTITEKKIIGIALDRKGSGKTSAYILPHPQFVACVKDKFEKEISNKAIQVLEKVYNDDSIEILMENNQVADNVRLIQSLA